MPRNKLVSLQWQLIRQAVWVGIYSVSLGALIFFYLWYELSHTQEWSDWLADSFGFSVPPFPSLAFIFVFLFVFWIIAIGVSVTLGFTGANEIKKRMEILIESTLHFERGNIASRIPDLGQDEIGQLGRLLNEMTQRFSSQVSSLQRLSTHNAELMDQAKHAAVHEERNRLARELHDAVSQQLFAISMTMAAVKRTLLQNPEKASHQVELVEEMAAAAQSEMRALLLQLRPAHLEGKTLRQGMEELLRELQGKHLLEFVWTIEDLPSMPKGIEDHLFRILQESISNILRHAKAHRVEIRLAVIHNLLRLKIEDDGIGFSEKMLSQATSSYGIHMMQERVAEIGGALTFSSAPGKGTMVEVTVPLIQ
ncbi:MAG TPA: sensor histidine kinase [Bacillota bacterium]|nr:sensor histidine kinase [Bacillota bacterium]